MQTRFYSGTVTFWVDWDRQEVAAWVDPTLHGANGRGLPCGFTLTDGCVKAVREYMDLYVRNIQVPEFRVLYDGTRNWDTLFPETGEVVYCRISRKGNPVLLHGLSPRAAYKWLIAQVHDAKEPVQVPEQEPAQVPEKFGDLYAEDDQGGDE